MDYTDQIRNTAAAYGVDPALALAVAQQESGFDPQARSSAGALGLFQLMPGTAADLGVDPSNPTENIEGGVRYLKQMLDRFGGDVSRALWAYNAGPGNAAAGVMPAETEQYIPAVLSRLANWQSWGVPEGSAAGSLSASSAAALDIAIGVGLVALVWWAISRFGLRD
jgi:soluble lytic murein transglycosylase-like protein